MVYLFVTILFTCTLVLLQSATIVFSSLKQLDPIYCNDINITNPVKNVIEKKKRNMKMLAYSSKNSNGKKGSGSQPLMQKVYTIPVSIKLKFNEILLQIFMSNWDFLHIKPILIGFKNRLYQICARNIFRIRSLEFGSIYYEFLLQTDRTHKVVNYYRNRWFYYGPA